MSIVRKLKEIEESAHPFLTNVVMQKLYSKQNDDGEITCFVVKCKAGAEIEEHTHQKETDIIFVLKGKATMWIEDIGSFLLEPGVFVVVPKNTKHRTYNVIEDLLIYDVFTPPMF